MKFGEDILNYGFGTRKCKTRSCQAGQVLNVSCTSENQTYEKRYKSENCECVKLKMYSVVLLFQLP